MQVRFIRLLIETEDAGEADKEAIKASGWLNHLRGQTDVMPKEIHADALMGAASGQVRAMLTNRHQETARYSKVIKYLGGE
jgi:hypothetical protein